MLQSRREASSKLLLFFSTILLTFGLLVLSALIFVHHHAHHGRHRHHDSDTADFTPMREADPPRKADLPMDPIPLRRNNVSPQQWSSSSESLPASYSTSDSMSLPQTTDEHALGSHGHQGEKHHRKCHMAFGIAILMILTGLVGVRAGYRSSPCAAKFFVFLLVVLFFLHAAAAHHGAMKATRHCEDRAMRLVLETRMIAYRVPGVAVVASETSVVGAEVDEQARMQCISRVRHIFFTASAGINLFLVLLGAAACLMIRVIRSEEAAAAVVMATVVEEPPKADPLENLAVEKVILIAHTQA